MGKKKNTTGNKWTGSPWDDDDDDYFLIIKVPSMAKQVNVPSLAGKLTVHRLFAVVGGERVKQKNDLSFSSQLESIHSSRCFPPFRDAGR